MENLIHIDYPLLGWLPSSSLITQEGEALVSQDEKLELSDWIPKVETRDQSDISLYLE